MKLIVNKHKIELDKSEQVNEGEYNVQKCLFEFSQEYDVLTKYAMFSNCNGAYKVLIVNNQCDIPIEVLRDRETFTLGVYGYYAEEDELRIRYSPTPVYITMEKGSYLEDAMNTEKPTPSDLEQLQTQVTNNKNEIDNLKDKCINYDSTIEEIQEDIIEINGNISTIEGNINEINANIDRLDTEQEVQNTNISNNASSITEINGEIDTIYTNLGVINGNIQTIEGNISSLENTTQEQGQNISALETNLNDEITNRENGDIDLQEQIDGIVASSDVKDIVGTYQELLDYDTSKLGNNDIIKVLQDSTRDNAMTYYRWITNTSSFEYVGQEGPYYTKSEIDTTLQPYVKNTDYATYDKGGVIKTSGANYGTQVVNGFIQGATRTFDEYKNNTNNLLISKGTLENAINGKGLVSNTDYASEQKAGVVRAVNGFSISSTGGTSARNRTYTEYQGDNNSYFISKGTLENVIVGKDLTTKQYVDDNVETINQAFVDMEEVFNQDQERQDSEIDDLISLIDKETTTGTNTLSYDKAKAYKLFDGEYDGNTYQETTDGKNLFEQYLADGEVRTQNGITITYGKGTILINGTATSNAFFQISKSIEGTTGESYVLYYNNDKISQNPASLIRWYQSNIIQNFGSFRVENRISSLTLTSDQPSGSCLQLRISEGDTFDNITIKPMLIKGTSTTEKYEPFTNGPAPNPQFPMQVETLKGWNLYNFTELKPNDPSLVIDENNFDILNATPSSVGFFSEKRLNLESGTYTISGEFGNSLNLPNTTDISLRLRSSSGASLETGKKLTLDTSNGNYISILYYKNISNSSAVGETYDCYYRNVQLTKGSSKPYLPYNSIGVRRTGKNIFNGEIEQGSFNSSGGIASSTTRGRTKNFTEVKNVEYTINAQSNTDKILNVAVYEYDSNYSFIVANTWQSIPYKFTPNNDTRNIKLVFRYTNNQTFEVDSIYNVQIENGNQATSYEPYQERIDYINLQENEMCKIGDVKDTLKVDLKGNVKLIKRIGKVVLDGSENWIKAGTNAKYSYQFIMYTLSEYTQYDIHYGICCNSLYDEKHSLYNIDDTRIEGVNNQITLVQSGYNVHLRTASNLFSSIDALKSWLAENKPVVYYELAEPQEIDLGTIEPIRTLNGTNNVEILATLEPTFMSETYAYDTRQELKTTEWNFYKAFMGTSSNALPTNWNELLITSNVSGEKSSIDIYKEQLVNGDNDVISPGYYLSSSSNLAVVFNINTTNNTIDLKTANYNGSNVAVTSQYRIYYR